jgi:hypothetical protein
MSHENADDLLLRAASLAQIESPQRRNQQSIIGLICNDSNLKQPDRFYIDHVDDLLALGGDKEHSWVHGIFEDIFTRASEKWSKVGSKSIGAFDAC